MHMLTTRSSLEDLVIEYQKIPDRDLPAHAPDPSMHVMNHIYKVSSIPTQPPSSHINYYTLGTDHDVLGFMLSYAMCLRNGNVNPLN
jgi:hypothetical protein